MGSLWCAPAPAQLVHTGRAVDTVLLVQQALVFTSAGRRPAPPSMAGKAHSLKSENKTRKTEVFGSTNLHHKQHLWVVLELCAKPGVGIHHGPQHVTLRASPASGLDASEDSTGGHTKVFQDARVCFLWAFLFKKYIIT